MAPLAACASWLAVGTSLASAGAEGAQVDVLQAVAAAPRLALPGPLRSMTHLTRSELLEAPEPVLVHSPPLLESLEQVGLSSFDQLRKRHGDEELLLRVSDSSDFLSQRRQPVRRYLEHLQDGLRTHLPETGGREFFLARPKLYDKVARAYSRLLPRGYSEMLDVSSWKSRGSCCKQRRTRTLDTPTWCCGWGTAGTTPRCKLTTSRASCSHNLKAASACGCTRPRSSTSCRWASPDRSRKVEVGAPALTFSATAGYACSRKRMGPRRLSWTWRPVKPC